MNFEEAVFAFSIGIASLIMFYLCAEHKDESGVNMFMVFALGTLLLGVMFWCLIVGLHNTIKTW